MSKPKAWPKEIKSGSATIKIYRAENRKRTGVYEEFKVVYYDRPDHRIVKTFSDYDDAYAHGTNVLANLTRGDVQSLTLTSEDRLIYLRAKEAVSDVKVPLDIAASEYAAVKRLLGAHSLKDAVEFYLNSCRDLLPGTVRQVVDELIQKRKTPPNRSRPASRYYIQDMESRLGKFADSLQGSIRDVGNSEIRMFLNSIKGTGRTWFNYARLLKTLFRYAQANRYYPKNVDPFEGIEIEHENDGEVEIFTPVELRKLLATAKPDLLPFLTIGAFAGLRHAEICRLDWADVKKEHIEVKKGNAKTRSRRLVPIQPNLAKWLAQHRQDSGPVVPYANLGNQLVKLISACKKRSSAAGAKKTSLKWKRNGLRHSFVSYRIAIVQNENQVAMEAGNSPTMIHQNYRELVTDTLAKEWFSIVPASLSNIIKFKNQHTTAEKQSSVVASG